MTAVIGHLLATLNGASCLQLRGACPCGGERAAADFAVLCTWCTSLRQFFALDRLDRLDSLDSVRDE